MTAVRARVDPGRAIVAVGEEQAVAGFALAGVRVRLADGTDEVREAWSEVSDAAVVILTSAAAAVLGEERTRPSAPLTVVMPP